MNEFMEILELYEVVNISAKPDVYEKRTNEIKSKYLKFKKNRLELII